MAKITLNDISLKDYDLTERVSNLKKNYFKSMPEICTERPRLITKFHLKNNLLGKQRISILIRPGPIVMFSSIVPRWSVINVLIK